MSDVSGGGREYRCGIWNSLFFAGLLEVAASLSGPVLPRCFSLVRVTPESVPRSARCGCSWRSHCCQQDLIGVGVGETLLAPLRCDNCPSTHLNSCNIYLWSWGSTLEQPPFFRLLFFPFFHAPCPFRIVSWDLPELKSLPRWYGAQLGEGCGYSVLI